MIMEQPEIKNKRGPKRNKYNKSHIRCDGSDGCVYVSDRLSNLARHKKSMHERNTQDLICCGSSYLNKAEYEDHQETTHSKGYQCPECPKVFNKRAFLHRHSSIHTGLKEFGCHLCDYRSSHKYNVERHTKKHQVVAVPKFGKPSSTDQSFFNNCPHPGSCTLCQPRIISHSIPSCIGRRENKNNKKVTVAVVGVGPGGENEVSSTKTATFLGYHGRSPTPSHNASATESMMGFPSVYSNTIGNYYFNNDWGWNYNLESSEENSTVGITSTFSPNLSIDGNYSHKKFRVAKRRLL